MDLFDNDGKRYYLDDLPDYFNIKQLDIFIKIRKKYIKEINISIKKAKKEKYKIIFNKIKTFIGI